MNPYDAREHRALVCKFIGCFPPFKSLLYRFGTLEVMRDAADAEWDC